MADPVREYDKTIIAEADRQRKYDLERIKLEKEREANQLREERMRRDARRTWIGFFFLGLAGVIVILAIVLAVVHGTTEDRKSRERERMQNIEVAETCIKEGNIWLDGNCLLANKNQP